MQNKIGAEESDNKGMDSRNQPSTFDWLKLLGLFVLLCFVSFDIFAVRVRNKALERTIDAQKYEMDEMRSSFAKQIQTLNDKVAVRDGNKALERTIGEQKHEMDKMRVSFEKQIKEVKNQIDQQKDQPEANRNPAPAPSASPERKKATVRCSKCDGNGEIEEKKWCEYCGGSGKIKETHKVWKDGGTVYGANGSWWNRRGREKISTIYSDCTHCLPGGFRGGGSKGYRIEKRTCPKCNGKGRVEID